MIIPRKEFYEREDFRQFQLIKEVEELMSVDRLYKEIVADAPFRNHAYLFKKGVKLNKLNLQEETVGIKKAFPEIQTEGERMQKIAEELKKDTYESVPVFRDIDYPDVIYLNDGFHRVYQAYLLGYKVMRVKSWYGKWVLKKAITIEELPEILGMLERLFDPSHHDIKVMKKTIEALLAKDTTKTKIHSIRLDYGREPHHEKNTRIRPGSLA